MENTTEKREEQVTRKSKKSLNIWMITTIIFLIATIVLGYFTYDNFSKFGSSIKPQAAGDLAIKYIQENYDPSITLNKVYDGQTCFYKLGLMFNGKEVGSYVSTNGKLLLPIDEVDISKEKLVGNFEETDEATACQENGKPIVYFFGTSACPHCQWEKPVIQEVAAQFGDAIVYKEDISDGASPFQNAEVFAKYSAQGSVPAIVLGCKYFRVGSGESTGAETEKANLTSLICKLTNNQPSSICK